VECRVFTSFKFELLLPGAPTPPDVECSNSASGGLSEGMIGAGRNRLHLG